MARDTQLIVRIPAVFNINLSDYKERIAEKGVFKSKSDLIVDLAMIGYHAELNRMNNANQTDNETNGGRSL
jgi:hypothetical protein